MIKRAVWGIATSAIAALVAVGCSASSSDADDTSEPFTRTIVRMAADGAPIVTTEAIDPKVQRQRAKLRIAGGAPNAATNGGVRIENCPGCGFQPPPLTQTSCDGASMWLYDRPYYVGNEICFFNGNDSVGSAKLRSYPRSACNALFCFPGNWDREVASWEAGSQGGTFDSLIDAGLTNPRAFAAWESDPNVSDGVLFADVLMLLP
jgi:hypothetical protein